MSLPKIFITSDLHFNHKNIITYCERPFETVDEMNEKIIKQWNSTVGKDDIVIILGDLAFGNKCTIKALIERLHGHKRLIMGNHDNFKPIDYINMGFEWVSPFPVIWQEKYILSHIPLENVPEGYINLYGHVHTDPTIPTFTQQKICVCCDRFNFKPQVLSELITKAQEQQ